MRTRIQIDSNDEEALKALTDSALARMRLGVMPSTQIRSAVRAEMLRTCLHDGIVLAQGRDAQGSVVFLLGPAASSFDKIVAIKVIRAATDLGLKEAKELVEGPMPVRIRDFGEDVAAARYTVDKLRAAGYAAERK